MTKRAAPLLYVEDEVEDAYLVRLALKKSGINRPVEVVTDGEAAIEYLSGTGRYANRDAHPLPCLVLLDLNLPLRSGLQVLEWIRSHPQFRTLPVVIYSSSGYAVDINAAKALGVQDYLVKDGSTSTTRDQMRTLARWLGPPPRET